MLIAITNDDGATAPGLAALHRAVEAAGLAHRVLADQDGRSNVGTALRSGGDRARLIGRGGCGGSGADPLSEDCGDGRAARRADRASGCTWTFRDSTPALLVVAACGGPAGTRPDLVLSGVNDGPNVGRVNLHSGTVGAASAAAALGFPAIAVSCDDVYSTGGVEGGELHFGAAARLALAIAGRARAIGLRGAVNVNVPNRPLAAMAGAAVAGPAAVAPTAVLDPEGFLTVDTRAPAAVPGDEVDLLTRGYVTLCGLGGDDSRALAALAAAAEAVLARHEPIGPEAPADAAPVERKRK